MPHEAITGRHCPFTVHGICESSNPGPQETGVLFLWNVDFTKVNSAGTCEKAGNGCHECPTGQQVRVVSVDLENSVPHVVPIK